MSGNVVSMSRPEAGTFDEFWLWYPKPRRVGRALAKAKWDAITNGGLNTRTLDKDSGQYVAIELQATPTEIIEGVKRYDKLMQDPGAPVGTYKDGGKYVMHPSTWLNRGAWMD